jgi:hypothetical protein
MYIKKSTIILPSRHHHMALQLDRYATIILPSRHHHTALQLDRYGYYGRDLTILA